MAEFNIVYVNGAPRVCDIEVSDAVQFGPVAKLRKEIVRRMDHLEDADVLHIETRYSGTRGGRPAKVYWLTERQVMLLLTDRRHPSYTMARVQVQDAFRQWECRSSRERPGAWIETARRADMRKLVVELSVALSACVAKLNKINSRMN